jgi:hypothetical protein
MSRNLFTALIFWTGRESLFELSCKGASSHVPLATRHHSRTVTVVARMVILSQRCRGQPGTILEREQIAGYMLHSTNFCPSCPKDRRSLLKSNLSCLRRIYNLGDCMENNQVFRTNIFVHANSELHVLATTLPSRVSGSVTEKLNG